MKIIELFKLIVVLSKLTTFYCMSEDNLYCSTCKDDSYRTKFYLTEVIPSGLILDEGSSVLPNTGTEMIDLINSAESQIIFSSLYFSLIEREQPSTGGLYNDSIGRQVFESLLNAASRGVDLYMITSPKSLNFPSLDLEDLKLKFPSKVHLKYLEMKNISRYHSGIMHTKMIIVDKISFYLGSSNADYRALSEIVEIGVFGRNNPTVSKLLVKVAKKYYLNEIMQDFEDITIQDTNFQKLQDDPIHANNMVLNPDTGLTGFISVSPSEFVSPPFQEDYLALLSVINSANNTLILAMMDYTVGSVYLENRMYWDTIDSALRRAAYERNVYVRIITNLSDIHYTVKWVQAHSLNVLRRISVKRLILPKTDSPMPPFSRLWHAKFAASESEAWISTNNVTPDYFLSSAGVSFHISGESQDGKKLILQMEKLFYKYWNSSYTEYLPN